MDDKGYIVAAANSVAHQLTENPIILSIPIDPTVAEFMGAFMEDAVTLADMLEDGLLTVNSQGEVHYEA